MIDKSKNATEQAGKKKYNPADSLPKDKQFGQPNGNPRNNGGVPKRFLEIRKEIANLLDPNLTLEDYKKIYANAGNESAIRAVFAEAVIKRDIKTIFEMINQAHGKPKESVEHTGAGGDKLTVASVVFVNGKDKN